LEGPYGDFSYANISNRKQVWIAGGVGITPFLSMARSLGESSSLQINLFYAAEKLKDAVFLNELIDIERQVPANFDTTIIDRHVSGYVSAEMLEKQLGNLKEYDFMICGPPGMMKAITSQLIADGVEESSIHSEEFSF
jgi:predicted ferric reductase